MLAHRQFGYKTELEEIFVKGTSHDLMNGAAVWALQLAWPQSFDRLYTWQAWGPDGFIGRTDAMAVVQRRKQTPGVFLPSDLGACLAELLAGPHLMPLRTKKETETGAHADKHLHAYLATHGADA